MTEEKKLEDFLPNKNGSYYKKFELKNEVSLINKEEIIKCIKTVMDPEIPVNLYDLGLIYSIKNNDIKIYGDFFNQTSIISFNIDGIHFNDLAMLLDKKNIAIRTGHHCAQPFMKRFNISGNARMSVGVYNTKDDIDYFIKSIDEVKKILKS